MERTLFLFVYTMTALEREASGSLLQQASFPFDVGLPDQNAKVFQVVEEAPNGTEIHGVSEFLQRALNFGQDAYKPGSDLDLSFQLLGAQGGLTNALHLDPHSGKLTVVGRIDREALCTKYPDKTSSSLTIDANTYRQQYANSFSYISPPTEECVKKLEIIATLSSGSRQPEMKKLTLSLSIDDINDNSPQWPQLVRTTGIGREQQLPVIELQVLESPRNPNVHVPQQARLQLPGAHDPDAGLNGRVTYRISPVPGDNQYLHSADASTQPLPFILEEGASGTLELVSTTNMDFEKQPLYEMYLIASDSGNPPLTSTALVKVHLIDVNDESPVFEHEVFYPPSGAISEKTVPGTLILNLSAADADASPANNRLRYLMLPNPAATKYFIVHPDGRISLRQWLDYETMPSSPTTIQIPADTNQVRKQFVFRVQAVDSAPTPYERKGEATVVVPVIDENDEAPVINPRFFGPPELTNHGVLGVVTENAVAPVRLAYIQVRDPDFNGKDKVSCQLTDTTNFSLVPVRSINLADLSYTTGEHDDSNNDYMLTLLIQPDRERTPVLQVRIKCLDTVGNSNEQTLRIRVLDVNDEVPTFTKSIYRFRLSENTDSDSTLPVRTPNGSLVPVGHRVGKVIAHDNDLGENAHIIYRLAPDRLEITPANTAENHTFLHGTDSSIRNTFTYSSSSLIEQKPTVEDLFRIDEQTGVLYALKSFDAENVAVFRLNVLAVDQAKESVALTGTAEVEIRITDVNDWPPVFYKANVTNDEEASHTAAHSAPVEYVSSYVFHVRENKPPYWLVGRIAAIDPDIGQRGASDIPTTGVQNSQISLQLAADSEPELRKTFSVHSTSGYLRTRVSLDREKQAVYVFNVVACDTGSEAGQERSATATVTVFVEDENDNDPVFIRPVGAVSRAATTGESKLDSPLTVNPLAQKDSAQAGGVSVRRGEGSLSLTEGTPPHQSPLGNRRTDSQDAGIPIVVVHRNTWSQYLDRDGNPTTNGRPLLQVEATDADSGENGRITYRIGAGNPAGFFTLDNVTGILMISPKIAIDQQNTQAGSSAQTNIAEPPTMTNREYRLLFEACDHGVPRRCATPIWVRLLLDVDEMSNLVSRDQLPAHMTNEYIYPESLGPLTSSGNKLKEDGSQNAAGAKMVQASGGLPENSRIKYSEGRAWSSGGRNPVDGYYRSDGLSRDQLDKYNWNMDGVIPNRRVYVDGDGRSLREFNHAPTSLVVSEAVIICLVVVFIVLLCAAGILFYLVRRKSILYTVGARVKSNDPNHQVPVAKATDSNVVSFHSQAGGERLETDKSSSLYRVTQNPHPDEGKTPNMTTTDSSNLTGTQGTPAEVMSLHALLRRNSEPLLDQGSNSSRLASLNESIYMSRAFMPSNFAQPVGNTTNSGFCQGVARKSIPQSPLAKMVTRSITPFWELTSGTDNRVNGCVEQPGMTESTIWKPVNPNSSNTVYHMGPQVFSNRLPLHSPPEESRYPCEKLTNAASYLGVSPPPRQAGFHLRGDSLPVYAEQLSPRMSTSGKWPAFHPVLEHQPYQELANLTATLRRHNYPTRSNTWIPQDKVFSNTLRSNSNAYGPLHPSNYVLTPRFHYANAQLNSTLGRPTSPSAHPSNPVRFYRPPSVLSRRDNGCEAEELNENEDLKLSSRDLDYQMPDKGDDCISPTDITKRKRARVLLADFVECDQVVGTIDNDAEQQEQHDLENPTFVESVDSPSHKVNSPSYSRAKYVYDAYREASFV
ncbi:hypothetical protein T265_05738 [Opisthorchis viverrini]|uniref:Cadherin domain-containing protein n=1 Tax=Opisthorchis viverrini TaxID=6198 RepID=A0A074ZJP4_OPIVI|nr:hypothetical protein T265_05738 [Opisthorchis viverrini]KER27206.1 hypothetical protein T265_05738 [Opisthorchis viverrini]